MKLSNNFVNPHKTIHYPKNDLPNTSNEKMEGKTESNKIMEKIQENLKQIQL